MPAEPSATAAFLGLQPTHNPLRWVLPVTAGVCGGGGNLFGGCGLGAAIAVLEAATERPLIWANCQFLAHAAPPDIVDLDVHVAVRGNLVTQARVTGRVGEREILHVQASLGRRPAAEGGTWMEMPDVPPPEDCPPRKTPHHLPGTFSARVEQRVAIGQWGRVRKATGGRSALWVRLPEGMSGEAAGLGIVGDFVPSGIAGALEANAGGRSLDNALRAVHPTSTEWVLCDIRVEAVAGGFGHGTVFQWAQDGTLLAVASQSSMVKIRE